MDWKECEINEFVIKVGEMTDLVDLHLGDVPIEDKHLKPLLRPLKKLRILSLSYSGKTGCVTDRGCEIIAQQQPYLQSFQLSGCEKKHNDIFADRHIGVLCTTA